MLILCLSEFTTNLLNMCNFVLLRLWRDRENVNFLSFSNWCEDFYFLNKENMRGKEALTSFGLLSTGNQ